MKNDEGDLKFASNHRFYCHYKLTYLFAYVKHVFDKLHEIIGVTKSFRRGNKCVLLKKVYNLIRKHSEHALFFN